MNLITIYDTNGQELDMESLGLMGLKLSIPSPSYKTITQEIDGSAGAILLDRILNPRKLTASFISQAKNYFDSLELRDKLYGLLGNGKEFYISENTQPTKRWKVYLDDWTPDRFDVKTHVFEIPMTAMSGTSETISTVTKRFNTSSFRFKNEGNQNINPRIHSETEIEFSGPSVDLVVLNRTTGDEWSWNGTTVAGDKILLKGVKSLKNGASIFGQTNKKLITFAPGWNEIEISGNTDGVCDITIKTRFYFL